MFGELLNVDRIRNCGKNSATLELFAYGNWTIYEENKSQFLKLTNDMAEKLKMLSLVELCSKKSMLKYEDISNTCGVLNTIDDVEALVLSCCFEHLIQVRIDQRLRQIYVISVSDCRDVTHQKV